MVYDISSTLTANLLRVLSANILSNLQKYNILETLRYNIFPTKSSGLILTYTTLNLYFFLSNFKWVGYLLDLIL